MSEYIERSAAIEVIRNQRFEYPTWPHIVEAKEQAVRELEAISAADVETVRHGKPVYKNRPEHYDTYSEVRLYDGDVLYKREHHIAEENPVAYCPECGERLCTRFTNYCPNCGARMDAQEKED